MGYVKKLNWGLIGASNIAKTFVIPAIRANEDSQVIAVMSSSKERAQAYAIEHNIPKAYDSLDGILQDSEIDIVYISTTNDLHYSQAIAAARAGKHVLCEKPLALTLEQAKEMIKVCKEQGVVLGTNHHLRNSVTHRTLKKLIADGVIGRPLSVRAFFAVTIPDELQTWRIYNPLAGAGPVMDLTVHVSDSLRFILNDEVEEVIAFTSEQGYTAPGIEDVAMGVMKFKSGILAQFHDAFNIANDQPGLQIHGTEGSLYAEGVMWQKAQGRIFLQKGTVRKEIDFGPHQDNYIPGIRRFNQAVRGDGQPVATGEDGMKSLAIALAVLESAKKGRSIKVQY